MYNSALSYLGSCMNHQMLSSSLLKTVSLYSKKTGGCRRAIVCRNFSVEPAITREETDYVIVGAGSAGCVLANRLTEDSSTTVTLVEAGRKDKSWKFHMPAALMYTLKDPVVNWCYYTTPQKHMQGRTLYWPRARVWGGCSNHNAMVYIRGNALDYDRWESEGATGWSYKHNLPYFRKSETFSHGSDEYRGGEGPTGVTKGDRTKNPLFGAFINAGLQAGYPYTDDINGYQQEGFGHFDMTIWKGSRSSTSTDYLWPVLHRPNLKTKESLFVTKILFNGKKAVGIEYQQNGATRELYANKEVIVSAGAINSPQLLMLSGIGNPDHLKALGIPVVCPLPGVGENLQDHLEVYIQHKCTKPITLYKYQWKFPITMIKTGLEWFLTKTGAAASTHMDVGAFIRSRPGVPHPDIQYHFLPSVVNDHGQEMGTCHAFQVHVGPMRETSRGTLKLASKDPRVYPLMDPNYLATEEDRVDFRNCVRLTREIFAQNAFDEFRGEEILPGVHVNSDKEIDAFVEAKGDSSYHPSCTCKMGQESDKMAVVNTQCQVFGVENLRVVDASIMPSVVSGNLNGPTIMIAEKAADIIRGKEPLPPSKAKVYSPPDGIKSQR